MAASANVKLLSDVNPSCKNTSELGKRGPTVPLHVERKLLEFVDAPPVKRA